MSRCTIFFSAYKILLLRTHFHIRHLANPATVSHRSGRIMGYLWEVLTCTAIPPTSTFDIMDKYKQIGGITFRATFACMHTHIWECVLEYKSIGISISGKSCVHICYCICKLSISYWSLWNVFFYINQLKPYYTHISFVCCIALSVHTTANNICTYYYFHPYLLIDSIATTLTFSDILT